MCQHEAKMDTGLIQTPTSAEMPMRNVSPHTETLTLLKAVHKKPTRHEKPAPLFSLFRLWTIAPNAMRLTC